MIDVFFLHLRGPGEMIEDARVEKIFVFFFLVRLSDGHVFVVAAIKLANLSQFWVRKKNENKSVCLANSIWTRVEFGHANRFREVCPFSVTSRN